MNRLRKIRTDFCKSQKEIADYLEMEQTHYSRYELNKVTMRIDKYKKLAIYYNVSLDYLCELVDIPKTLTGISYEDNLEIMKRAGK